MKVNRLNKNYVVEFLNLIFFIFLSGYFNDAHAGNGIASTGIWNLSTTWIIDGASRVPTCGDTLSIPSGVTVTVDAHENYTLCNLPMYIKIYGTLQLIDGYKINLPCSSTVKIFTGGVLKKFTSGGGNSTYIHICGCDAWTAAEGTVNGPDILNCSLLPVELLSFSSVLKNEEVLLNWATASETNNDFFSVERSSNGNKFNVLSEIKGAGNSTIQNNYSFADFIPLGGVSYYRLKQTDFNGKESYSEIIAVNNKNKNSIQLISYFVNDDKIFNLTFQTHEKKETEINIFDSLGKVVYKKKINSIEGLNQFDLILPLLKQGSYVFNILYNQEIISEKIIVN